MAFHSLSPHLETLSLSPLPHFHNEDHFFLDMLHLITFLPEEGWAVLSLSTLVMQFMFLCVFPTIICSVHVAYHLVLILIASDKRELHVK